MLSGIGHICIDRRYYACRHCKAKQIPWESWAGVGGPHRITPHAQRMIVLAGSGCSFEEASRNLQELCHIQTSNDIVRAVCHEEGAAVQKWMHSSPEPQKAFSAAGGVVEADQVKARCHHWLGASVLLPTRSSAKKAK